MSAGMEIVTGSYEQIILGLSVRQECDERELTESFTEKTIGSIKCVATSDKGLLAAGGTDEIIRIFDLKKHRLVGTLTHHSGTVTSLQFCDTHLFSTSEDGTLCLWRVATWEPERTFKGHKGPVKHVAVHPSGKMTLTVGQDRTLRLWNNMTGRSAYISNLKEPAELVSWSPGGVYYVVAYTTRLDVFRVGTEGLQRQITAAQKVNSVVFVSDTVIAYGGEGKFRGGVREPAILFFTDVLNGDSLFQMEANCDRIRGLAMCDRWLTLVGSDGAVNLYEFSFPSQESIKVELTASRNISLRLTSVAICKLTEQTDRTEKLGNTGTDADQEVKSRDSGECQSLSSPKLSEKKKRKSENGSPPSPVMVKKKVKITDPEQSPQTKKTKKKKKKPNKPM